MKYNPFDNSISDMKVKHAQVIYLRKVLKIASAKIAEITGYAISTIRNYITKFSSLLDWAKEIFNELKEIVEEKIEKVVEKKDLHCADIVADCEINCPLPCAYIVEMFDAEGAQLWLKIGKAKDILARTRQHFKSKTAGYSAVATIIIRRCFYCNNEDDALTMENALRKHYKEKEDCGFIRNDRFSGCFYDKNDIDNDSRITMQYNLLTA